MKVNNENFDKVLNKLVASTRSPRGRFTAENSWRLLESRLLKRRSMKRFWMRTASAAAVVLLCVTSWAPISLPCNVIGGLGFVGVCSESRVIMELPETIWR